MGTVPTNLRQDARNEAADKGEAMSDGSFPIRSLAELEKAINAYSLTSDDKKTMVRTFIIKRAKALGASPDLMRRAMDLGKPDSDGDDDSD